MTGRVGRGIRLGGNRLSTLTSENPRTIDIDRLTEAELIALNHRIIARLRFLNQMRAHSEMLEFRIGDRVTFRPPGKDRSTAC